MATFDGAPLRRLGGGPVATVYLGQRAGVSVALKVFPKKLDKRTMAAYIKEQAKLSAARRVSSVLLADGVDELDTGEFATRMEPCTQSLAALVDRVGAIPPADAVVLGRAVAEAIAAAHGCGVVHGGISPHNILFRATGEPVLADFGVTLRQAFARDPLYAIEFLPPETLRTGVLNESTDLYGLGAVLHFALSGRSPHPGRLGEQAGERVLRILGEPVPALNNPDVPVVLSTLVARLLSADAARRIGDASAVADQLGAMLPDAPQRPADDDFDDFSAPHRMPPPPVRQAPPPPPVASMRADGDEFDDFALPAYRAAPRPPVARPPVAPPLPPLRPTVAHAPVVAPPPGPAAPAATESPVAEPSVAVEDEGADTHRGPEAVPDNEGADQAAQLRALRGERMPLAVLSPADTRPPAPSPGEQPAEPSPGPPAEPPTAALPAPATVEFHAQPPRPSAAIPRHDMDFDDDFADPIRGRGQARVLAGPLAPPGQPSKKLIRYDLLAGAALLIALLALVPLFLLRGDPEEISSTPRVPSAGGSTGGGVEIKLDEPVDMTDEVRLTWTAPDDLDFVVVIAAEGKDRRYELVERHRSMTLPVEDGLQYCFLVQATDGEDTYESNVVALRDAICRK